MSREARSSVTGPVDGAPPGWHAVSSDLTAPIDGDHQALEPNLLAGRQ